MFSIWKETIEAFDASFDLNSASLSNRILHIFKILSNLTEFHRALTSNRVYVSLYIYIYKYPIRRVGLGEEEAARDLQGYKFPESLRLA